MRLTPRTSPSTLALGLAAVATTAAMGAGSASAHTAAPGAGAAHAIDRAGTAQASTHREHQRYAYAVLQAPGWTKVAGDGPRDGRLDYTNGDDSVSVEWHVAGTDRAPYKIGERNGATTMDDDRSPIFVYQEIPTAVGPVRNQHFLTFSSPTLSGTQLGDLAGQVHRQAYATLEAPGWVAGPGNVPTDDKLYYTGPGDASASLNWRPADDYGPKFTSGTKVGATTLDGDPATVYEDPAGSGYLTVVAKPRAGKFLTLSTTTVSVKQARTLASHVHRR